MTTIAATAGAPDLQHDRDVAAIAEEARRAADLLKALAHEGRLTILCVLARGERSVSELEELLTLPQPTVSQLLARLRADGLVTTRRDGRQIYYQIADAEIRVVVEKLHALFCGRP